MVLLYHAFYWTDFIFRPFVAGNEHNWLMLVTQWGFLGVELFFVLSGFLITGILLDTRERPDYFPRFYKRRALRILPALIALLIILFTLKVIGLPFFIMSALFMANLVPLFGLPLQYIPLWSLAVEEQFYFLWPQAVRRLSLRWLAILAAFILVAMPAIRWFTFIHGERNPIYVWFVADGFAMGALLAIFLRTKYATRSMTRMAGLALVGIGILILLIGLPFGILQTFMLTVRVAGASFLLSSAFFLFGGLMLLTLLVGTGAWSRVVTPAWLRYVGRISYGLYLVHWLVFIIFDKIVDSIAPETYNMLIGTDGGLIIRFVIAGGISVVLAALSREYFEEYFLKRKGV